MMMAEVVAFDNLEGLDQMGSDLAAYVRRAVVEGVAAHEAEEDIWRRILAMGSAGIRPVSGGPRRW